MPRDGTTAIGVQPRKSACCSYPATHWSVLPVVQATEAIYIDSPQSTVWALLAQMGQDREDAGRTHPGICNILSKGILCVWPLGAGWGSRTG